GAALDTMTQSLAYKGVRKWITRPERPRTTRHLKLIEMAIKEECNLVVVPGTVWLSLRKDPVSRRTRDFLWKAIHGAHRTGAYWGHIPGYEGRKMCGPCAQVDDMCHILTLCEAAGQAEVWALAKELLRRKGIRTPQVSLGLALGAHIFTVLDGDGMAVVDKTRMARIILMEATQLIWALRCERVIGWEEFPDRRHAPEEIRRRFEARLNQRLSLDQSGTNKRVHKKKALSCARVRATWQGLLKDEHKLSEDWLTETGVLVGM
ncbi:uncharacterized protein TRAVEDRAFT_87573, partial [Trametes versicolor FP-101664 SS1]|uniref:uncharacterized protein n=1 Tax=Trametes versicolor (strain FP-101664) TaxID=717944 RepID=UPI0004622AE5